MSQLFDLLTSNIGFLFIVLGGLYSIYKRNAAKREESKPPVPRKPNQPRIEEVKRYEGRSSNTIQPVRTIKAQEKPRQPQMIDKPEMKENRRMSEKRITNRKKVVDTVNKHKVLISGSPDQIVQGVIWSEILGPPKAKSPYLTKKTNRV